MKHLYYLISVTILLSCSNNTHTDNHQQSFQDEILIKKETINPFLLDSLFCTDLLLNSNLITWAISSDENPIITIEESHFLVDTLKMESHLNGKLIDGRSYHGKKNRIYRYDVCFRDTSVTNVDFELYEITKDCFGKDVEFPTTNFRRNGERYTLPYVVGQRIYMGFDGRDYADIIKDEESSRTYRTNKRFDLTDMRDFSYYYDKDFSSKYFVTAGSNKPYGKVEHWKSPNRLVIYNYPGNTYVVLDYESLDIIDRDYIN